MDNFCDSHIMDFRKIPWYSVSQSYKHRYIHRHIAPVVKQR
ncbi:unnamed protein product [Blumeria hordei]|uniref:Uncharacterized protein n=1 Tax=Blumeria hordei TaxID=2867405 RepID=A0A383V025_BLUHO|nr:unnamed protein product [Blumeria hordei]